MHWAGSRDDGTARGSTPPTWWSARDQGSALVVAVVRTWRRGTSLFFYTAALPGIAPGLTSRGGEGSSRARTSGGDPGAHHVRPPGGSRARE
jgi:hypothetical protein